MYEHLKISMNGTDDLMGMDSTQIRAVRDEIISRMGKPEPEANGAEDATA